MSTLKVEKIQHPNSASVALTLDTSGYLALQAGSASTPAIQGPSDPNTGIFFPAADTIAFAEGGTEVLRIDSNGRVGIGTSSPNAKLHVNGGFYQGVNGTSTTLLGDGVSLVVGASASSSALRFEGDTLLFSNGSTNRMTLTSSGLLGIGTISPQGIIDTLGTGSQLVRFQSSNSQITGRFVSGNSDVAVIEFSDQVAYRGKIQAEANDDLSFYTGGISSERARIDSSGRLLVGTSSPIDNSTGTLLQLKQNDNPASIALGRNDGSITAGKELGNIKFYGTEQGYAPQDFSAQISGQADGSWTSTSFPSRLVFSTTADGASSPTERFRIANTGRGSYFSSSSSGFQFSSSPGASVTDNIIEGLYGATGVTTGTLSFLVRTNGNVLNTNSSYGALSDLKLKENIVDAASQWDDIKALRVRKYNFKEGQTHTQIGVIAQEVEQVSPGLVTESPDRDAEGNDLGTTTKAVQYSVLYMKAVKALQEAMERIETLEAKVAALESA